MVWALEKDVNDSASRSILVWFYFVRFLYLHLISSLHIYCLSKDSVIPPLYREGSGSVVECLTGDRGAAGLSLTGVTAMWSLSKTHLS